MIKLFKREILFIQEGDSLTTWLKENHFFANPIDGETEKLSLEWEREYQITDQSRGVDQEDITLIAYAKRKDKTVVTLEGKQDEKPRKKYNYKIPLVCSEENVPCIDFVEMIDKLNIVV